MTSLFVNLLDIGGAVMPCFFGVCLSSSGIGPVTSRPVIERDGVALL